MKSCKATVQGMGLAPAQPSLLADVGAPVLPRALWVDSWHRMRLCALYALPGDLGLWIRSELDFKAYACVLNRNDATRRAKRGAGLVSLLNKSEVGSR
jgi:hypothetical protein